MQLIENTEATVRYIGVVNSGTSAPSLPKIRDLNEVLRNEKYQSQYHSLGRDSTKK
jgi:hypothetical protein